MLFFAQNMITSTKKLLFLGKSWPKLVEFGRILAIQGQICSNLVKEVKFDQIRHSNLSYESRKIEIRMNSSELNNFACFLLISYHKFILPLHSDIVNQWWSESFVFCVTIDVYQSLIDQVNFNAWRLNIASVEFPRPNQTDGLVHNNRDRQTEILNLSLRQGPAKLENFR